MKPRGSSFWRSRWFWSAAVLSLLLLWLLLGERGAPRPRPLGGAAEIEGLAARDDLNVLFVLIDTLRRDRLHTYGYHRPTSPFFDLLGAESVRFERNSAQSSWTKCSMASLWTALHPQHSGVTRFEHVLAESARLPAEILREAGFRTAGIWRNGWVDGYHGFRQGFDVYTRPAPRPQPVPLRRANPTVSYGGTDLDIVEEATEFLRLNGRRRWFLYLHLMDVHEYTYDEETARFGTSNSDVYDNAVLRVDRVLDQLFGRLAAGGYLAKTLTVIASDHGEAHGERGFEGHARNVYPETIDVPLFLVFPFRLAQGAVIRQRTQNVDIWPTLFDLLGLPPMQDVDGRSRVPAILAAVRGEPPPADETTAIAHLDRTWGRRVDTRAPNVTLDRGRFRYVQFRGPAGKLVGEALYDSEADARELDDRLEAEPEAARELRDAAEQYLSSRPRWEGEAEELEIDELELNQLRALGYALP